jgi:hypothetical protein
VLKLCTKKCDECLFTENKIVGNQRMKKIIQECLRKDSHFVCHKGSIRRENWVCRGFYEAYPGVGQLLRTMGRMRMVEEVDPESGDVKEKKHG